MTERLRAAQSNARSWEIRLQRAYDTLKASQNAHRDAIAELEDAAAEAAALPPVPDYIPEGVAAATAGASAHNPTVMTRDHTG